MPYVIGIAVVVIVIVLLVQLAANIVAYLAYFLTLPSIALMGVVQSAGLTDPVWYVVVHAVLGASLVMGVSWLRNR